ncbi:MAG: phosphoglycerate kinase [Deltaproteobacteria bacterium]|nr:phosphoglycerate kinase [Deltaproteobacteria bacterium]
MIKSITDLPLQKKRVFIRVDFNVSFDENENIQDDTRIRAVLPTLEYAIKEDAKVILASHLGRPKGIRDAKLSLLPVAAYLSKLLKKDILFPEDCIGDAVKKLAQDLREGQVMLLENLRFHEGEEKNDAVFSEKLASIAEVYVNDAFGTLHRAHASTVGMVKHFKYKGAGFLVRKEVDYLSKVLENPERPLVAILGGAKVSDKLAAVDYLLSKVDALLIGGAMAYTFLKAMGKDVGSSLVEDNKLNLAAKFMERAKAKGVPLLLPVDHRIAQKLEKGAPSEIAEGNIPQGFMGLDIGPKTIEKFGGKIIEAKTVIWNGPMGVFEVPPFNEGTFAIAKLVAKSKALSVVGGGDSAAAIMESGLSDQISHISTGGGATLACFEGKLLPGLQALKE